MGARELTAVLRRRWSAVVVLGLLGVAASGVLLARAVPSYTASTTLFFSFTRASTASELNQGTTYTQGLVKSFAEVATSAEVLGPVVGQQGRGESPTRLARRVEAVPVKDTVLLTISAHSRTPADAAATADAVAAELSRTVAQLTPAGKGDSQTIDVTTLAPAQVPRTATAPRTATLVAAGLVLGLLAGLGLAALLELLDIRVRDEHDLRRTAPGVPVLGDLSAAGRSETPALAGGGAVEPVRRLRENVLTVLARSGARSVVVTSPSPHDGRTTMVVSLAEALAESGVQVLLVEADLRHPSVAARLGLPDGPGLVDVLQGDAPLDAAVRTWGGHALRVLPAGSACTDPGGLLASGALGGLLAHVAPTYDVVLLDSPDLAGTADALALGKQVDGVLLLVRALHARPEAVEHALDVLRLAGVDLLGVVLSRPGRGRRRRLRPRVDPPDVAPAPDHDAPARRVQPGPDRVSASR